MRASSVLSLIYLHTEGGESPVAYGSITICLNTKRKNRRTG